MKKCELCNSAASMYCGSDRAVLCWDCDTKIHAANFLVAKHVRTLLCHACQSPTPWTGSGPKFGPTVSVCETCFHSTNRSYRTRGEEEEAEDELETDTEEEEEEDDDGNDQVVPVPPPLVSTSPRRTAESSSSRTGYAHLG
ncbi:hypothetical protein Vadar_031884 [Vaccinium darrowii]|uniref:Uncharacterized protein n=1 Tax=Vaccinium darrowii TaxID=229202 RepID=A0ACB7XE97_9ERIC|nr:hypothetical protein Vadar_031884 [Vaccinium darrowii]